MKTKIPLVGLGMFVIFGVSVMSNQKTKRKYGSDESLYSSIYDFDNVAVDTPENAGKVKANEKQCFMENEKTTCIQVGKYGEESRFTKTNSDNKGESIDYVKGEDGKYIEIGRVDCKVEGKKWTCPNIYDFSSVTEITQYIGGKSGEKKCHNNKYLYCRLKLQNGANIDCQKYNNELEPTCHFWDGKEITYMNCKMLAEKKWTCESPS